MSTETPSLSKIDKTPSSDTHSAEESKVDRIAEEAAEKSGKTEKKFDRDHNIFTK
jgi:hypothetical protein